MKKILSLVLVLALCLSVLVLAGCGKKTYPKDYESIVLNEESSIESITLQYSEGTLSSNAFFPIETSDPQIIASVMALLKDAEDGFEFITNEKVLTLTDAYISVSLKSGGSYVRRRNTLDRGHLRSGRKNTSLRNCGKDQGTVRKI
jgi:hypothetical protein